MEFISHFAKLVPALHLHFYTGSEVTIAPLSRGGGMLAAAYDADTGFLRAVDGYSVQVDAELVHGIGLPRIDATNKHIRPIAHVVLKNRLTGGTIYIHYEGVLPLDGEHARAFRGDTTATPGFKEDFVHVTIETGDETLKHLEEKCFVATGRMIKEDGKPRYDYLISEVVGA